MLLTAGSSKTRLLATKRGGAILLSRPRGWRERWLVEQLVQQLCDQSMEVAKCALEVLTEACDDTETIKLAIELEPPLQHLGDAGRWLQLRFLGTPQGLQRLQASGFLDGKKHTNTYSVHLTRITKRNYRNQIHIQTHTHTHTQSTLFGTSWRGYPIYKYRILYAFLACDAHTRLCLCIQMRCDGGRSASFGRIQEWLTRCY